MEDSDIAELLDFGLSLADKAEQAILPFFKSCSIEYKPDGSEVTDGDRFAEEKIRDSISKSYPTHGILGEEFGESDGRSRLKWILDPIDGTTAFSMGLPSFGTLIALTDGEEPIIGIVRLPALQETLYASKGAGCWHKIKDKEPVKVTAAIDSAGISEAFISSAGVHSSDIHPNGVHPYNLTSVIRAAKRFRFFGDCTQHMLVCEGKIHCAIDTVMKPWDTAALLPCISESGGVYSTIEGDRQQVIFGGSLVSCSHDELLDQVVSRLMSK